MQTTFAKFSAHWDPEALRPDLAVTNITRFLIGRNIIILFDGTLLLNREAGNQHSASFFQIDLSLEINEVFFTKFADTVVIDESGFFTFCQSYSVGGVKAVISGIDGNYHMFIDYDGHLCIERAQADLDDGLIEFDIPIT